MLFVVLADGIVSQRQKRIAILSPSGRPADSLQHRKTSHIIRTAEQFHGNPGALRKAFGDENGIVSEKGLEQLKKVMPQIDPDELRGKLEAEKVITLFTVGNLADMVAARSGGA